MKIKHILSLGIISTLLVACGGSEPVEHLVAKGGKKYGGEFRYMSKGKVQSVFPAHTVEANAFKAISQLFEPLLTVDPKTLEVKNNIAESHTVSDDATEYTFKIRKGVFFHEDDCLKGKHELDAEDVKFSLEYACSGLKDNKLYYLLVNRIKGAREFNSSSSTSLPKDGVSGIQVVDKYTLKITLVSPQAGFDAVLTHPGLGVFAKESYEAYKENLDKHAVGTGPFMLESFDDNKIELKRNPHYWKKDEFGNQLPFLSKVIMTNADDKRSEMMAFRNSEIDMVWEIPVDQVEYILGTLKEAQEGKNIKHKVKSASSMSIIYLSMNNSSELFSNEKVRQAINLSINTNKIVDDWLEGEGWSANGGIVPTMGSYPNEQVKGLGTNVEKARKLLSEAGYPNGKGFPSLELYVADIAGSANERSCQAIASQLNNALNINLSVKLTTAQEKTKAIQNGTASIWLEGWLADYPDPENFLSLFYGGNIGDGSMVNLVKFNDEEFNNKYKQLMSTIDPEKRTEEMVACDKIIATKSPVVPILSHDHIIMINDRVRNFEANSLETLNLTSVYIKEAKAVN